MLDGMRLVFSSRRRHTRSTRDWSSDVCSSDLKRPTSKGTFELEPAKKPREIDLISGTNVAKGIYGWEDEHLKLCISPVNKARPTEFVSNPQVNRYYYILKRQKP